MGWSSQQLGAKAHQWHEKRRSGVFYHSGDQKQIVGILEVISNPYPNPKEKDKRFVVVDVKHKKRLKRPVTLAEIKKEKKFKDWELLRISRLSVMPVPKEIWDKILEKSQAS